MTMITDARPEVDRNVAWMLWDTASRVPDRTAIVEPRSEVSYERLARMAGGVASALEAAGLEAGDRVVVFLERGAAAAAAYFGILAAGGVTVVVNETLRARQVEYALRQSGAGHLITSEPMTRRLHRPLETGATVLRVEDLSEDGRREPVKRAGLEPAQITYTSGSTGLPKGVVGSHTNVHAAIGTVAGYLGIREDDRFASLMPFSSVYGANQLQCAVLTGAALIVDPSPIGNAIAESLRTNEVTVAAAVPPLWAMLLHAPAFAETPIESLRIMQNAGGHLAPALVRQLRHAQPQARLFLQYGMTEVFRTSYLPPEEIDRRPDSMGRPMPGTEVLVVREDDSPCEPGETGQLVHCGPTVTLGYWDDPDRTAETYRRHPHDPEKGPVVYSGDMVRRDEDGYLYFVGRRDRMIKTLGYKVGPDEILDALYASDQIVEGIVTAANDERRGTGIVAFVVLKPGGSLDVLRKFIGLELPRYMQPARLEVLDSIPRTPGGKHDLLSLREMVAAETR